MSNMLKTRLLATSAIAGFSLTQMAAPAQAQAAFGIHNDQTDTLEITIPAIETVEGDIIGVYADNGAIDLDNQGTIIGNGTISGSPQLPDQRPDGGVVIAQPNSIVVNSGSITGVNGVVTTYFFGEDENDDPLPRQPLAANTSVTNSGSITATGGRGVALTGGGTIVNSGTISGTNGNTAAGELGIGAALSQFADNPLTGVTGVGTITNEAGGVISGDSIGAALSGGGTINNAGTISAPLINTPASIPFGITLTGDADRVATVNNSGTINGFMGILASGALGSATIENSGTINASAFGINQQNTGTLTFNNGATGQLIVGGNAILSNAGTLNVDNGGLIQSSGQNAILIQTADAVVSNSGTIDAAGAGVITGAGNLGFVAYNAMVINSGTITGLNNDGVRLAGGGTVTNSGTITGITSVANPSLTDGISIFNQFDQDLATYVGSVTNAASGSITGASRGVIVSGGGTIANAGSITGGDIGLLVQNGNTDEDGNPLLGISASIVNSGSITGNGETGVLIGAGLSTSTLTNSGTITGTTGDGVLFGPMASGLVTIVNEADGDITGALSGVEGLFGILDLTNAGTIRGNGRGDGINVEPDGGISLSSHSATIANSGDISGAQFGIVTYLSFNPDTNSFVGTIIDTAITNSGTITGENDDGIRLAGGGTVTNSGTIQGLAQNAFGGTDGVSIFAHNDQDLATYSGTLINLAGGVISGQRAGAAISSGGSVTNAGTITGAGQGVFIQGSAIDGVLRDGQFATLINSGTITGTGNLGGTGQGGFAVSFGSNLESATLENSGTIRSSFAEGVSQGSRGALTITNLAGGLIEGGTSGIYGGSSGTMTIVNAGMIRGNGTYDGFAAAPDAGITIATAGSSVTNSGSIYGSGAGITTAYLFDTDLNILVGLAKGTQIANSGVIVGDGNDGVRLIGGGAVTNSGSIFGAGNALADGISMFRFDDQAPSDYAASVVNSGAIGGDRFGIILSGGGTIDNSGGIVGEVGGIQVQGDAVGTPGYTASVRNSGTITSTGGAAISGIVQTAIDNSGILTGGAGIAIDLGDFDDVVTLRTGSAITGSIEAGGGTDTLNLEGGILELTAAQQIGAANGFEALNVGSGYWTTAGVVGAFDGVAIGAGGALQVNEVGAGATAQSPIETGAVTNNGLLVLNFGSDDVVSDLADLTIAGTGRIQLIGEAAFTLDTATIAHTGGTTVSNGGLILTGVLAGNVATEGDGSFTLGAGGTEGSFAGSIVNNGRFVFNRSDDYSFLGGFSGSGILDKRGAGVLTFTGDYGFQGVTNIFGGAVRIGGTIAPETKFDLGDGGTLDITGKDQTIGGLSGAADTKVVVGDSQLTISQTDNSAFAGAISGNGGIVKTGGGTLNLTGNSTYTGPTSVNGGKLAVNGSIVSPVTVNTGGTLGGNGTVGSTTAASGGTIAPGNSIGRLTVAGNLGFAAGSTYEVETNAAGAADRIDATGRVTIDAAAKVAVLAENGAYNPRTDYIVLTGAGGVSGTFGSVTSNLAFLTPLLRYGSDRVTLSLYRNDIDFTDVAVGFNQTGVAAAIQSLGFDNPLFEGVLVASAAGAQTAYTDLSGEILASTVTGLNDDSRYLRGALMTLPAPEAGGAFVWGSAFGGWGDFDAKGGQSGVDTDHTGLVAGIGIGGNGFAAALSAGIGSSDFRLTGRGDKADADSKYLAAHATYGTGDGLRGAFGISYGWHDVDTNRTVAFAPLAQTLTSSRDADTLQVFGEVGYDIVAGTAAVTPFARLAHVRTKSDAFTETGGSGALAIDRTKQETTFLSLGLRGRLNADAPGFQPFGSLAWNRAFDDRAALATGGFAAGGTPFAILGNWIPKNSAEIEAGFDYSAGAFRIGAAYSGTLASDRQSHGARITARIAF